MKTFKIVSIALRDDHLMDAIVEEYGTKVKPLRTFDCKILGIAKNQQYSKVYDMVLIEKMTLEEAIQKGNCHYVISKTSFENLRVDGCLRKLEAEDGIPLDILE
mgnify:CR=1 FL=1